MMAEVIRMWREPRTEYRLGCDIKNILAENIRKKFYAKNNN